MGYEAIILEKKDRVAKITLNRPESLNSINEQLRVDLDAALDEVAADDEMRVLVVTGAGRGFCSGVDVRGMGERAAPRTPDQIRRGLAKGSTTVSLQKMEKPTIGMINGVAAGAGCDMAFSFDLRTGCENTRFINAFVRIGLFPGGGGSWLYPKLMPLGIAFEYLFTGDAMSAEVAEKFGVLNRLVPADKLEEETMGLAQKLANGPPIALRLMKLNVYEGLSKDYLAAQQLTAACETITLTSADHKEGVKAFMEKRKAIYQGIQEEIARLGKRLVEQIASA